ncbi:virulence factor MviN [Mobiluncus curtisii]|uniref:murein biosynthesis integral membrane protein MurJ n=1 Tax=Mobiluncus curtisii TaxID=2051 RepID=UPI001470398E|nr:lipid II flippase MurJ [Mobiluncus curtisii]MCV0020890.1 virulence factor MviN [Mobiluncus curtisii]NMW48193.1 virulence factor MviN [Mobiluncus curtisii]
MRKREKTVTNPVAALAGAAGTVAVITLVSRVFGFGRWLAQATWVGADTVGNAYASANQIPNVIFEVVVGGALASITIPLLAQAIAGSLKDEVNRIASALLTWTLTMLVPLGLIVFVAAEPIAAVLPVSVGSDVATQNALTAYFLRVFAFQIPLYGVAVVLGGILQAHHRFAWPALMPAFSSVVTIGAYAAYGAGSGSDPTEYTAITALAWGTTAGVLVLSVPLFIPVWNVGVRLKLVWKMPREQFRHALTLGAYGIGALLAAQGYMLATLFLTRWGGVEGTINVFQYSQAIYLLPYALFTFPVATVVFPLLTRSFAAGQTAKAGELTTSSTALIAGLSLLGVSGLIVVAPGMAAIFAWNRPIPGLEMAVVAMAPALVGYALLYHLSRVFIALNHAQHSFFAALLGWGIAAISGWLLIIVLAPSRGNGVATLLALGAGNVLGMSAAGVYLLIMWGRLQVGSPAQVLRALLIALPGAVLGGAFGRLSYAGVMTLDLPLGVLWAILAAGFVAVICALPGLKIIATPFWKQTRTARQVPETVETSENLEQSSSPQNSRQSQLQTPRSEEGES